MPGVNRPLLVRPPRPAEPEPDWDEASLRVLEHRRGPLRVLGGPGTGKTTLVLEAVSRRIRAAVDPENLLVLASSRRAAAQVRERISARLVGELGTIREPLVRTVHSYAFGLLRLHAARLGEPPPRLLAGPEQDSVVRELLAGELAGDGPDSGWPHRLRPALELPGFAVELRELLLRAAERGVGPRELIELGQRFDVPEWAAAGRFYLGYERVNLLRGGASSPALDAAELVSAALDALAADPELLAAERARIRHLFVDDAHDLDPQQMRLVGLLGATAETFLLVGDPDQAVLGFRGADPTALRDFDPERSRTVVLTVDHRAAPALLEATARLAARLPGAGPARARSGARSRAEHPGELAVRVFASAAQEAGWIADRLRRAHLTDGVPWSQMAVLVRSITRSLPVLRRALLAAGVPMAVPPDELPLSRQPAVLPLLLLLRCAARPERIDADAAVALLSSPLGGADPLRLRRLRRGLLALHLAEADSGGATRPGSGEPAGGSDELLVAALRGAADGLADPLPTLTARDSRPLRSVAELLGLARAAHLGGASAEEVLWRVWRASGLAGRWAVASAHPGPTGAQADRDLDAVVALFDAAARYTDRLPGGGDIEGFAQYVADQRIPGDSLAPRAPEGEAVAVLTAHAARGREWRLVAVAGVQEGSWPDPRLRGTLLGVERLVDAVDGAGDRAGVRLSRVAPLLAEERRLFYVACGRARDTLLVSAVRGEDEQPSRFLDELDPPSASPALGASPQPAQVDDGFDAVRAVTKPPRALVLAELIGELRRAVCASEADGPPGRRERAAAQLARLAAAGVPGAHPDHWYGLAPPSTEGPLCPPDRPVSVSPSAVEKIRDCPLKWLFERHGGDDGAALPSVTGSLVHALVQASAAGAAEEEVEAALRRAWSAVDAGAPWYGRRELERVRGMLSAFRAWLTESRAQGLTQVDLERVVELTMPAGEGEPPVLLRGRVDRLERDGQGRPVIVDVKTGRTPVSREDALVHPQLAVYQLAAALGAFREALAGPRSTEPGGARLLYLGGGRAGTAIERMQPGLAGEQLAFWRAEVLASAAAVNGATFEARQNSGCERCGVRTSCPANDEGRAVPGR